MKRESGFVLMTLGFEVRAEEKEERKQAGGVYSDADPREVSGLLLWQIDICYLREAVTQHPADGECHRGAQLIKYGLFRNNHRAAADKD